ncbi:RteC domain-containing protein [Parabacteroides johnsonii]|jgi:DNA polymerase III delta prime subunit|uniref:RteC domain-containing protein n=2 Tax=Parabacteroides johnsonii TaxID=387661 RepID=A0AAW6I4F9_9BACT|nr:RteC domain-containing protein [Parabacteroides johnsonii]MBS6223522.1 RteC domain-containing protein [Parabacteroides johnsonii]MDC7148502.1 RteC domain-containing protein [Parabacteroides johnsonii]MDC7156985.1 RteC domain-containing protein [Parabacteroides johnsonii]
MKSFVYNLEKDIEKKLKKIESADLNILKKSLEASLVLGDAFQKMKEFISTYTFRDEVEEIEFFKVIKPRLFYRLIYYRKIYNIEMNRPVGVESQRAYLIDEIKAINRYNAKRSDFVRYYRSGLTHMDSMYYLRGSIDTALYLESFHHERDPSFSTNCDFKVARILANELLIQYLTKELEVFEQRQVEQSLPRVRLTWNGTKTELVEQIFAWDSRKVFGNIPLTRLAEYIQTVFNIELDKNFSRTFGDMRIRNRQTPFLDSLKEALLKRMNRLNHNRGKNKNE